MNQAAGNPQPRAHPAVVSVVPQQFGQMIWQSCSYQNIKILKPLVETGKIKTLQKMWLKIEDVFRSHKNKVTASKIESKWKSLERAYKNCVENKSKTGRARKTCAYKTELDKVFAKRHSIKPVCLLDSNQVITRETKNTEDILNKNRDKNASEEHVRKNKSMEKQGNVLTELRNLQENIKTNMSMKKEMEEAKLKVKEKILAEMKGKNDLLEKFLKGKEVDN